MDSSVPVNALELVVRLVLATVLGAAVGVNRELHQKPAGFRTHAMVALGAALMTLLALSLAGGRTPLDTAPISRVLQGIIAGIGFVGGGAILRRDDVPGVHGLTTATSIWVVAAVGMAVGLGMWLAAATAVALALLVLTLGGIVDRALDRLRRKSREHAR